MKRITGNHYISYGITIILLAVIVSASGPMISAIADCSTRDCFHVISTSPSSIIEEGNTSNPYSSSYHNGSSVRQDVYLYTNNTSNNDVSPYHDVSNIRSEIRSINTVDIMHQGSPYIRNLHTNDNGNNPPYHNIFTIRPEIGLIPSPTPSITPQRGSRYVRNVHTDQNVHNTSGCSWGQCLNKLPSVTTLGASSITPIDVRLNGSLNPNGTTDTKRWFEWGTNQWLGNSTSHENQQYAGNFSEFLSNLQPNTVYYFRAVAQNSAGIVRGAMKQFTTSRQSVASIAITHAPTFVAQSTASS